MKNILIICILILNIKWVSAQWINSNSNFGLNIESIESYGSFLISHDTKSTYYSKDKGRNWVVLPNLLSVNDNYSKLQKSNNKVFICCNYFAIYYFDTLNLSWVSYVKFPNFFNDNSDFYFLDDNNKYIVTDPTTKLFRKIYLYKNNLLYNVSLSDGRSADKTKNIFKLFNNIIIVTELNFYKIINDSIGQKINILNLPSSYIYKVATFNNNVFAITDKGFFVSYDTCQTWTELKYMNQTILNGNYADNGFFHFPNNKTKFNSNWNKSLIYNVLQNTWDSTFINNSSYLVKTAMINNSLFSIINFFNTNNTNKLALFYSNNNGINWSFIESNKNTLIVNNFYTIYNQTIALTNRGLFSLNSENNKWLKYGDTSVFVGTNSMTIQNNYMFISDEYLNIFRTSLSGNNWKLCNGGAQYNISSFNNTIYTCSHNGQQYIQLSSKDNGEHWDTSLNACVNIIAAQNNLVYGLQRDGKFVYSNDGATSWIPSMAGADQIIFEKVIVKNNLFLALGFNNTNGIRLLYRSLNKGASWFAISNSGCNATNIQAFTASENFIYFVNYYSVNPDIYEYNIQTQSCRLINSGTDFGSVTTLYVKDTLLFAGTEKQGIVYLPINNPTKLFIYNQPQNQGHSAGDNAVFSVGASGPNITYQWQANAGLGFTNISDLGPFSGSASNSLHIQNIPLSLNNTLFRCMVYNSSDTLFSDNALLTVFATGINDLSPAKKINVYPNPTSRECFIENVNPDATWELYDCQGNNVGVNCTLQQQTLSLSALKPGLYFLTILQNNTSYSFKVIREE